MEDMEEVCACKGIRTCLICEDKTMDKRDAFENTNVNEAPSMERYVYCSTCGEAWIDWDAHHPHTGHKQLPFHGIQLIADFISKEREKQIAGQIDQSEWVLSQSGRRKQDYGPKVNFKRKKVKKGNFTGLPAFSRCLLESMCKLPCLQDFSAVELCNLEYTPDRGSAIDPHFDDFWLWGERLVTLNLLSDTFLSFICDEHPGVEVAVPMPARSLIVVSGDARFKWKHCIHRQDITDRRLAVTLRELTPEFLQGGSQADVGKEMLEIALTFHGLATGS